MHWVLLKFKKPGKEFGKRLNFTIRQQSILSNSLPVKRKGWLSAKLSGLERHSNFLQSRNAQTRLLHLHVVIRVLAVWIILNRMIMHLVF